jgi:hypothetical protein
VNALAFAALLIAAAYFGSSGHTDGPALLCVVGAGLVAWLTLR